MKCAIIVALLLTGCTIIGVPVTPEPAPYPYRAVTVCVHGDGWPVVERAWPARHGILLVPQCPGDWTFTFIPRPWWHAVIFSALPEVLGYADDIGGRHVVVFTGIRSVNRLLWPPHMVLRHEIYHLLGCGHALIRTDCYTAVRAFR